MRAIKEKLNGILEDPRISGTMQTLSNSQDRRQAADRVMGYVKEKGSSLVTTVHGHVSSVSDMTGALAKQKLLQTLFSSGVIKSEHIRLALQMGIGYFLDKPSYNKLDKDSIYVQREKFPAIGGVAPAHTLPDFDIEAYGVETFNALMLIYGISPSTLKNHICDGPLKEIMNPSSSGSLLYLTSDATYLVKTARDYDVKFIQQKFLQEYYHYLQQNPGTFLAKLFGVYGYIPYMSHQMNITVDSFALRFAIISNIIPTTVDIHEKYDLKGSSYKRDANFNERIKSSATFKDNDFRDLHPNGLKLPKYTYFYLKEVLTRDVDFLQNLNIMDYSLLLTIHNLDNNVRPTRSGSLEALMGSLKDTLLLGMAEQRLENKNNTTNQQRESIRLKNPNNALGFMYEEIPTFDIELAKKTGGIPAINEKGERLLLFLGIIDILQTFDICKAMQRQYQTVENRDVVNERSIVEADFYANRFKEFIFEHVFRPFDDDNPPHLSNNSSMSSASSIYPQMPFYNQ